MDKLNRCLFQTKQISALIYISVDPSAFCSLPMSPCQHFPVVLSRESRPLGLPIIRPPNMLRLGPASASDEKGRIAMGRERTESDLYRAGVRVPAMPWDGQVGRWQKMSSGAKPSCMKKKPFVGVAALASRPYTGLN